MVKTYTQEELVDLLNEQTVKTLEIAALGFEVIYKGRGFAAQQVAAILYQSADACREEAGL